MLANSIKQGDTIGVISPSNIIQNDDLEYINRSILLMEKAGFKVKFGKYAFSNTLGYGSTAKEKAEDIHNMFKDNEVKAIFCAKGGYNSNAIFDYLDFNIIENNPKIVCGFSDSTSILNMIYEKTGLVTFNGPTFKSLTSWETIYGYEEIIKRFVEKSLQIGKQEDKYTTIKDGTAEGILIGGNLNLFSKLSCGKYNMNFKNKIIFIEELGIESPPAMVSNFLYTMKQNGVFDKINGIWVGNYEHPTNITLEKILLDTLEEKYNFPIIKSDNFGHIDKKAVIPIGTKARLDTSKDIKIELLENCVK